MARTLSEENRATARADVNVTDSDVNVVLEFGRDPDLLGAIHSDDPNEVVKPGLSVFLRPEGNGFSFSSPLVTRENGTFTLQSVSPARVRLNVYPMPDGHYIKSILVGNIQAEDTLLDLTNGAAGDLVINFGTKGATIAGTVQDDKQKLVTNAQILLVPDDRKLESRFEMASPDQNGQFTIKNVPPGLYKVFAFDKAEYDSWLDPEWLKGMRAGLWR